MAKYFESVSQSEKVSMQKKNDADNSEFQLYLESSILRYQDCVKSGNKVEINSAYKKIISLYNPLDFYASWYEQYKYLFDSEDDFVADYLRVFSTVLIGWKPRSKRKKSRYDGSGEFKNYFIGSLYHNYINLIKANQAAKRNLTKYCPLCHEWVNPISSHLIKCHTDLLWDALEEMGIEVESLQACPICTNFKVSKSAKSQEEVTELIKYHFISKHSSILFNKFNEMYPDISTIAPKIMSSQIEEDDDGLDVYDVTCDPAGLVSRLFYLNLSDLEQTIIEQALNGDSNLIYKFDKHKCTREEWDTAIENIKELITVHGTHY